MKIAVSTLVFIIICLSVSAGDKPPKDAQIQGNNIVNIEPDTQTLLCNPLNGWVVYGSINMSPDFWKKYDNMKVPGKAGAVKVSDYAHTLYLRLSWAALNPEEGVYGWDTDDRIKYIIECARQRKMRLAIRVVVDSRDKSQSYTPQYVRDAGAGGYETNTGRATVWSPYPDDAVFQQKYAVFVKAFAKKFNDPDMVDFIDGYGLGKWGEAHSVKYENDANREQVFKWVVDLYSDNFTRIPLAINYHRLVGVDKDWAKPDTQSESLLEYAFAKGYILRHDAFGMTDYYQQWEKDFVQKWIYRRPVIMEGGWVTKVHRYWNDPRGYKSVGDVRRGEFDDAREACVNMMDFRINETESWFVNTFDLVQKFISEGGYRLYPDQLSLPDRVKQGSSITISHRWSNMGWGYCPTNIPQWNQKYKVAFALLKKNKVIKIMVDEQTNLSKWIKGTPVFYKFTPSISDVPAGKYIWAVALVDCTKGNVKGLDIAAKGTYTKSGWLTLSEVKID